MIRKRLDHPAEPESHSSDVHVVPDESLGPDLDVPARIELTDIAIPIAAIHLLALFAFVPEFITVENGILLVVTVLCFGQGINLGYHRLLAHRSLCVPRWLEYFYVGLAIFSLQETPGKWVSTHRRHHVHSDDDEDPHSPENSFFWSHVGWLMFRRQGKSEFVVDERFSADILRDPIYAALERYPVLPGLLYLLQGFLFWVLCTSIYLLFGNELSIAAWLGFGSTLWAVILRTVVIWHLSWSVNSLTHCFGYQNYDTPDNSRNNWLVALFTSGEGWHNNHHHDSSSASNRHKWWEFDITYAHIRMLEILGLATRVVRPRHLRQAEKMTRDENCR